MFATVCLAPWIVAGGCADASERQSESDRLWTRQQAESIASIRGMPVHVRECRGLGRSARDGAAPRYGRFHCVAGTRAGSDPYDVDTVAVSYDLHPLGEYVGPTSKHRLTNVEFVGGPGIP